ncbi:MAG: MlaD family protein [Planctomycetota bacterium]
MEDRNLKWRVGVIAVVTLVVAAVLIAASTSFDLPFGVGQYTVQIFSKKAPGVGRNTPVRRDGVLIGRVDYTESAPGGRLITVHLNQGEPVLTTDDCQIRPSSLFGDAVIEFTQTDRKGGAALTEGDTVNANALRDPIDVITNLDVNSSVESLGQAGEAVAELATRINRIIGQEADGQRLGELLDKGVAAMDEFSATMKQVSDVAADIDAIIGDEATQRELNRALASAPDLVDELDAVIQQAAKTIQTLDGAIVSAKQNLDNIQGLTEPLGERGPELAQSAIAALENLELAAGDISRFAKSLGESEGTLGKLVNDAELYNNVNTTVYNANLVIARINELAKQLRPILNDVRVTTDKVAREPGRLLGGALKKGPGVK